ncbi:transposase [Myxococcus sp. AM009]|nr:transposase [Myxococcus sp. AM009]
MNPNFGLGQTIAYLRKHWQKLTLFLGEEGAPLDNNLCEQAHKKAILHCENAFLRMLNGAHVRDVLMSLIHTVELCGGNPFDLRGGAASPPGGTGASPGRGDALDLSAGAVRELISLCPCSEFLAADDQKSARSGDPQLRPQRSTHAPSLLAPDSTFTHARQRDTEQEVAARAEANPPA